MTANLSRRRARAALAAATLLLSLGCLDDRPIAPANEFSLQVETQVAGFASLPNPSVRLIITYQQNEGAPVRGVVPNNLLREVSLPIVSGVRPIAVRIDLLPCLRDPLHFGGAECRISVEAQLLSNSTVIDQQFAGSYLAAPGSTIRAKPLKLVGGTNPPTISLDTAVRVDPSLVVYRVTANDVDGNLQFIFAAYTDSGGNIFRASSNEFIPPTFGYSGPLFAFLGATPPGSFPTFYATAEDSKFASATDSIPVVNPIPAAPTVTGVTATARSDQLVNISFTISDPQQDEARVIVLFRDAAVDASDPTSSAVLGACTDTIPAADGSVTVTCTEPDQNAIVIVIPVDAQQNIGNAARGTFTRP